MGIVCQARLPEIEELQKQISAAHEELTDATFQWEQDKSGAEARERGLVAEKAALETALAECKASCAALEVQLAQLEASKEVTLLPLCAMCFAGQRTPPAQCWARSLHFPSHFAGCCRLSFVSY
jgi:uncharacterized protein YhaN